MSKIKVSFHAREARESNRHQYHQVIRPYIWAPVSMGNVPISCCRSKSPRTQQSCSNRGNFKNGTDGQYSNHDTSYDGKHSSKTRQGEDNDATNHPSHILQHISEREPDDTETDPSSNPLNRPIFAARTSNDARFYDNQLFKSSSCSTIFVDGSTISQPNLKQTIKCVSLAIYYHIKNRTSDDSAEIFDDSIHPLRMPSTTNINMQEELIILDQESPYDERIDEPNQKIIYDFVETLFKAAQLTSEYAITTLIYLERLMTYAEMDLTPRTWRRMFLGALLLSSKVWEDQAVWNVDYAQILEEISVDDINELERQFLELIQFNMNVPSSVYAKYYFHLRTLALKHSLSGDNCLLRVGEARTLEAMSRVQTNEWQSSPIHRKSSPVAKRYTSLEKLRLNGRAPAVLM